MIDYKSITHQIKGQRSYQEDRCFSDKWYNDYHFNVIAVADGMGGHGNGDLAADIAINEVENFCSKLKHSNVKLNWNELRNKLDKLFSDANTKINLSIDSGEGTQGMGTTLTCALIIEGKMIVGNIGDSRCYVLTKERVDQVTKDHSALQDALDKGYDISQTNVGLNAITQCLDGSRPCEPDIFPIEKDFYIVEEKGVLISSDGLHGSLNEARIQYVIKASNYDVRAAAENLVNEAYSLGSTDNISVALSIPLSWEIHKKSFKGTIGQSETSDRLIDKKNYIYRAIFYAQENRLIIIISFLIFVFSGAALKVYLSIEGKESGEEQYTTYEDSVNEDKNIVNIDTLYYTAILGDNATHITKKYKIDMDSFKNWNSIENVNNIDAGKSYVIGVVSINIESWKNILSESEVKILDNELESNIIFDDYYVKLEGYSDGNCSNINGEISNYKYFFINNDKLHDLTECLAISKNEQENNNNKSVQVENDQE